MPASTAPTARNIPPTIRCLLFSANGAYHASLYSDNDAKYTPYDTLSPLQRQRRVSCQPLQPQRHETYPLRYVVSSSAPMARNIPALAEGQGKPPPKNPTGLKARHITSRGWSIPNMFRAFSPLACFESHPLALQARLVCYAPSALRRSHAAAVGALGDACRWPLAGLSDHGKEMTPLGAPSASSAFLCRLPRRRSGHPMFRALGAEEG